MPRRKVKPLADAHGDATVSHVRARSGSPANAWSLHEIEGLCSCWLSSIGYSVNEAERDSLRLERKALRPLPLELGDDRSEGISIG